MKPNRCYVVAEISANHNQDYESAVGLVNAAKDAGADAVKLQTYTPDTMTLPGFKAGPPWQDRDLYELYAEGYMPWEWQPTLKDLANGLGMDLFSTAYDETAVDFLEGMGVPFHKVSSFEMLDVPLIEKMAGTGKPVIISTGMANWGETGVAVTAASESPATVLLKCTSAYPSFTQDMNLLAIPVMREHFGTPVGFSDHSLGMVAATVAASLGACLIEKHLTLDRSKGLDRHFSMEPLGFKEMVKNVRMTQRALGSAVMGTIVWEKNNLNFRRSLWVVKDVRKGERFSTENVRSLRPSGGLAPADLYNVLGRRAVVDVSRGDPLTWKVMG